MDEFEGGIITVKPGEYPAPSAEDRLQELTADEAGSFVSVPSIDLSAYQSKQNNWAKLFGQGFMDSLVSQGIDTPSTHLMLIGKMQEERQGYEVGKEKPYALRVGEKIRDFGIALRKRVALDESTMVQPQGIGEKIVAGLGSGTGSMLGMISSAIIGAAVGASAGPEGAAIGGTVGAFASSYTNEKATLAKELMAAGYKSDFIDRISKYYALPVAMLDVASFNFLGKLLRPTAIHAVESTIGKRLTRMTIAGAEGIASEGGTETIQQRIQTEFEIATKLKDRNMKNDLVDDLVAGVVGGMIGGAAGSVGQLNVRKDSIERISEQTGIAQNEIAKLVDEIFLRANELSYDALAEHFDVTQDMEWVNKAFERLAGREELSGPIPEVQETIPDNFKIYEDLIDAVKVNKEAAGFPEQIGQAYQELFVAKKQISESGETVQLREQMLQAQEKLDSLKKQYGNFLEDNPRLKELNNELQTLQASWMKASPAEKAGIEQRMQAISTRLRTPGEIGQVVKSVEAGVTAKQTEAIRAIEELSKIESDPTRTTEIADKQKEVIRLTQELISAENQAEGFRQTQAKLEGKVSLTAGQVRLDALRQLKDILAAYKVGRKFAEKDLRIIQKAFLTMLAGSKLSAKSANRMLRSVLSIRTPEQFNDRMGVIMSNINKLIRTENVRGFQVLGRGIIEKMLPAYEKVSPQGQIFAEHLLRVFREEVPLTHDFNSSDPVELGKAQVEQAVYDLVNAGDDLGAAQRAVVILSDFYKNQLQKFGDFKARQNATYARLADMVKKSVLNGEGFDELQQAFDSARQSDKRQGRFLMTPYDTSFLTLMNKLDNNSGAKAMEGPLVQEFDSNRPYNAYIVLVHQAKERVEGKLYEIYGKDAQDVWIKNRTQDFVNIKMNSEVYGGKKNVETRVFYRGGSESAMPSGMTAKEIINYEKQELGNSDITVEKDLDLSKIKSENLVWLTETEEAAQEYGDVNQEEYRNYRIIARDSEGGVLIEKLPEISREVNISRAEAMSLYLMTQMPGTYNDLVRMGIDEAWLESFQRGENVQFSEKDYAYMQATRETLDWFADKIAPVYEALRHRPFRRVDNYFMTFRHLSKSLDENGYAEKSSVIDTMLNGDFEKLDPTEIDQFKQRKKSDMLYRIPDLFEAVSFYANDMAHFIAYADYVVRLQNTFQDPSVRQILTDKLPAAYPSVINEYINTLAKGSVSRDSDRAAMKSFFRVLGLYARNQVASPKNFFRQLTGVSAAMDLPGGGPVKLVEALADLPRAIRSGELKQITNTSYMQERFAGLYEMAVLYVQEQARAGKIKGDVSQKIHNFFTLSPRYGDRFASIAVGWMIYRDVMKRTGDSVSAVQAAVKAIDDTQQSMDAGKTPVAFNRSNLPARLLTVFQRSQAIYFDRYLRSWDNIRNGRISKGDFLRTMLTFHVWIPLFEVLVTAGKFEPWETGLAMAAGPLSYHLIIGSMLRSILAGVMEGLSDNEAKLPLYLKDASDSTLIGSFTRDCIKLVKKTKDLMEYPDYESMWGEWKALGGVLDVTELPMGWLSRTPEGVYDMLQGSPEGIIQGAKIIAGWPESRTKEGD